MAKTLNQLSPRAALVEAARQFHERGWMAGTSGNLSVRSAEDHTTFWITASSLPKGCLEESDFLRVRIADESVAEQPDSTSRKSAETAIHRAVYSRFPQANACFHVHTVNSCLAFPQQPDSTIELPLPALELIKGLGVWDEDPQATLAVFRNHSNVPQIAANIAQHLDQREPKIPAVLIAGHGPTVWGASVQEAYNRVEALEFVLTYLAARTA